MIYPDALVSNVSFAKDFSPDALRWNAGLGFMTVDLHGADQTNLGAVTLLGFAAPYLPGGEVPVPNLAHEVKPVTNFGDLPRSLRCVGHVSKGVGTRLYNTEEVARSGSDVPDEAGIGLYTLEVARDGILDWRLRQGGRARQIARHAVQRAVERVVGPEPVVRGVHKAYGAAQIVRMDAPPRGQMDMHRRGLGTPEGVVPGFFVIRDPTTRLRRVGSLGLTQS